MTEEKIQKIDNLLQKAELDQSSKDLIKDFLESIANQPQFDKIIDLLDRFPALFENFCKCFQLKKDFLAQGKTEKEWNEFLAEEDAVLNKIESI